MFCINCGAQNDEGSAFCMKCGSKMEATQAKPAPQAKTQAAPAPKPTQSAPAPKTTQSAPTPVTPKTAGQQQNAQSYTQPAAQAPQPQQAQVQAPVQEGVLSAA